MANESDRIPLSPVRAVVRGLSVGEMNEIVGGTPNTPQKTTPTGTNKLEQYLELTLTNTLLSSSF